MIHDLGDVLTRVPLAPVGHGIGHVGDAGAEDERQPDGLDRFLVGGRDHTRVGDDRHVGQPMGFHEVDRCQHRGGLRNVALECVDHQREPGCIGERPL
jgi:hypothetical protein